MPGAKELSTVEWHSAHSMPTELSRAAAVEEALDADHRVQLQQRQRDGRVVQVDLAVARCAVRTGVRQRVDVDLQADRSAVFGLTPGPTPPFAAPAIAW